jgi:hypothetical protein
VDRGIDKSARTRATPIASASHGIGKKYWTRCAKS